MAEQPINSDTLFPHETGRHRSARERQRRGPMWGCLRAMGCGFLGLIALIIIVFLVAPFVLTRAVTANLIKTRIEATLGTRLGRDVVIRKLEIVRAGDFFPTKVILHDIQIANAPGGVNQFFARVARVEITGGIGSFRTRTVRVERIDIIHPHINFEVFPAGAALNHNFPRWSRAPKRPYEIYRLEFDRMFVRDGHFLFLDRRHDIVGEASAINSDLTITSAENLYAGIVNSPRFVFRLQDYEPLVTNLRGGFRFTPGVLALESIALRGDGVEAFVSGKMDPLADAAYDLSVRANVTLERIKQMFRLEQTFAGAIIMDTRLVGKSGDFRLSGGWRAPAITADAYDLTDAEGTLDVDDQRALFNSTSAKYGGGTISADYRLPQYAEPYPMTVDLRYNAISVEQLFADFGVDATGLRGGATGSLRYGWNKNDLLGGSGSGTARLARNAVAFSNARYPIPVAGSTDFTIDNGVIGFRNTNLETAASKIALNGSLTIENLVTGFGVAIDSTDFSELDRLAFNFARSAGKRDFELLGLGGLGRITGTVRGPIATPMVVAQIFASGTRYNDVGLGASEIALRYDGPRSTLTFDRAVFTDELGRLELTGTIAFPDRGPGPRFDIAATANNYSIERAVKAVDLDFVVGPGRGTGQLVVSGTPLAGNVRFVDLVVRRDDSDLRLNGTVAWAGEGDVRFNLDLAARDYPVADLLTFLDLGTIPVTGALTGTLRIEGPKDALQGAGAITVRRGTIFGEPVDVASANIVFDQGRMRATDVRVTAPAGQITGEAEYNFATERFGYTITSSSIDLTRLQLLSGIRDMFGGRVAITSSGGGTAENPELVIEATLLDAAIQGLDLPDDAPPPSFYVAIREGQLVIRGSIAGIVNIEGSGKVGENLAVDGTARIDISDFARLLALSPRTATIPAQGKAVLDLRLGGRLSPLEALVVDATFPTFDLRVSEQQLTPLQPLRLSLRNGRVTFDQFAFAHTDSSFAVTGFAEITGNRALGIDVRGSVQAALLQLFMTDVRAEGRVDVNAGIAGTFAEPAITGRADLVDAEVKFAGFPQLIDEINGTLLFFRDRVEIQGVRATLGGGAVVAGGTVAMQGLSPQRVQVALQGTGVTLRYYEGLSITGDFALQLTGDLERSIIQGDVNVSRALYSRDFDLQQSIVNVLLSRRGVVPVVAAPWQENVLLRINIDAPGALAVRNNIAEVTGSAELEVAGTLANPVILGLVELDEGGTVTFQNVDYNVARGTINFQNPFRIDPFFDVTLEGRVSGGVSELESGPIDLTINITGTLDRITPSITSDPPASDITLFSLLGFGNLSEPGAGFGAAGAAGVGQGLLIQGLVSTFGTRILPFADSFTYDPGLLDTGSGAGPKVTFEKRLSNDIRVLVVYNLDSQKSREVIEWQATRDWTVQVTRDESENEYRAEGRFRRRYRGHWTWGGRGRGDAVFPLQSVRDSIEGDAEIAPLPAATRVTEIDPATVVQRVDIRADGGFDSEQLRDLIDVQPGETVSKRALQSSIRALHATGNFRDIRVHAEPAAEGGVVLTFALSINYRIGTIDIEGVEGSNRRRAERRMAVRIGEVLSLNAVDDTAVAIQDELRQYGYLEAIVDPETVFVREQNRANVIFHVTPGPEAKVSNVVFEGDPAPFTEAALLNRMRQQPGRAFRVPDARLDADRIREFLFDRDHRRAVVEFLGHQYDAESNTTALRYRVETGPLVRVEVVGVSRRSVRRQLPFRADDEGYSEDIIEQAAENIVRSYQERGYFEATVDTESTLEDNVWTTTFRVDPGQRYRLSDVTFSGNMILPDDELKGVVATAPGGGIRRFLATLFRRPTGITREQLSEDRAALEAHYRLQGFSQAVVASAVVTPRANGTLEVDFPITEGPQTVVANVVVEGNEEIEGGELPDLVLRTGDPLNPQTVRDDIVRLQTFYADRGYAEVQVTSREELSDDRRAANIIYVVSEGQRVEVGDIVVRGNTYTNSEVVLRTADLDAGDPFSYTNILQAQQNLYRLGTFQRVDVQPDAAGTDTTERNVVISVEEGRNLTVTGSAGLRYETSGDSNEDETDRFAPRIAAAAAHRNLFGTGRFLGVEGVWSQDEQEAFITYREPFIGRYNVPVQLTIFQTDDGTVRDRRIRQRGTSIEASKIARARTRWSAQYQYKISDCVDGALCDQAGELFVPGLDPSLLDIQISSITPTFFWDRRDDIIDPHRGFFTSASVEYAFPLFSAETRFTKEFVQGAWYIPVSERSVFALSARVGLIQPRGADDPTTPVDESRFVPVAERFTAGGDTSHRAYPRDLLGTLCDEEQEPDPSCTSTLFRLRDSNRLVPLGGNGMFIFNAEYRFPIFSALGGAVFADAGNVFGEPKIDFGNLRYGVGLGFRYLSPVGPLRIDIGWPLDRPVYYDRSFNYSVTLGYAF